MQLARVSRWFPLWLLLGVIWNLSLPAVAVWGDDDEDEDETVHELMEKVHEGKNSPWKKAGRAAEKNPIDWPGINGALPRLVAMSEALAASKNPDIKGAADGYIDAVKDLLAQAKKQNAAGARTALTNLSQSCGDCHYKGGPGGKLDD